MDLADTVPVMSSDVQLRAVITWRGLGKEGREEVKKEDGHQTRGERYFQDG
jgi:hypothetical protein